LIVVPAKTPAPPPTWSSPSEKHKLDSSRRSRN
jgi:hypothetical protein